jgi:hypothetical protein
VRRLLLTLLVLGLLASSLPLSAEPKEPDFPACVRVTAFARYGAYGYDHIVTIANGCDQPATCAIATNVNPSAVVVRVEPGREESVVTFRGSPSSEFSATVRCKLQG